MSISDNYVPVKQLGNGVTTQFSGSWAVLVASYIQVFLQDTTTSVQTPQVLGVDFTLVFNANGFTVTFAVPPPNTKYVVIGRDVAQDQTNPYRTSKGYQGQVLENSLDKLTAIVQDQADLINRAPKLQLGSTLNLTIPAPIPGHFFAWNPGGTDFVDSGISVTDITTGFANLTTAVTNATNAANTATAAAMTATNAANAAAASAASINFPAMGAANTVLNVNGAGNGYQYTLLTLNNLNAAFITSATGATLANNDEILFGDVSASNAIRKTITATIRQIPQNSQSAAYTLQITDANTHIYHPTTDATARIWTIPANSAVAFDIGTAVTFVNDTGAGAITIAITTDTLVLMGTGSTGSRTLAANGVATALKVTATRWIISGTNLS